MKHKIYSNNTFQLKAKDIALDAVFNLLPINFCWFDRKGYLLGCNQNLIDCFNINSFKDVVGKHSTELVSETTWSNTQKVLSSGESFIGEEIHLDKNFNPIYFLSMKHPMKDCNGDVIGVVNISFDITDRKSMEMNLRELKDAAELANKVKTDFLTNMRHDLRTPLTGILSISEFLQNSEAESFKKNYLNDIKNCAESMLSHLNQILHHIKAESGEFLILEEEFNIHNVLQDVHKMMSPVAKSKQLDFTLVIDHVPKILIGDAGRTQRILMNLVSNAIKFTQQGFVGIEAKWIDINSEEGVLNLVIEDSGIGIALDKQTIIFEKFHRLHPSHEGVYKGDGLGLNIVKQFLRDIKGEYTLTSDLGKGTVFKVKIPYKAPLTNSRLHEVYKMHSSLPLNSIHELITPISPPSENSSISKKKKILIVEDNEIISRISKDILEALDLEVDVAENGEKALSLLHKQYNLVIMDIGLPDISGYDVTRYIRGHSNPEVAKVPIIAITAHSEEEERKLAMEAGANEIFPKPLTQELAKYIKTQVS